ncbi:MAG: hypothetical protein AB7T19_04885 [Planctomycetota bacterium]
MTTLASTSSPTLDGPWLHSPRWDRVFVTGGALLVVIPIALYYLFQSLGVAVTTAEDLVTLVVMVLVGGPHVFATYTRTFLEPGFRRREPRLFFGAFAVFAIVLGAAVSSAFFDVEIAGFPPIQFVLTFFFFWAGVHIVHQSSYLCAAYEERWGAVADRRRRFGNALDYLVMLGCLYPVAFFRMSMILDPSRPHVANPDALATQIVTSLSGNTSFADAYVFRIGRVAPILPDFVTADAFWIVFSALYCGLVVLFAQKSWREHREGTLNRPRFQLVVSTALVGLIVPLFPNLDTAFQGFNAWHSFQYLGIVWLWNRNAYDRGEVKGEFVRGLSAPGRGRVFYRTAFLATLGLLSLILLTGWLIETFSAGKFVMFGHPIVPTDPATGEAIYRPGSVLLAYYMVAFSLLLTHYLHDGHFFFRTRDLRER